MNRPGEPFDADYDAYCDRGRLTVVMEDDFEPPASYMLTVVGHRVLARFKAHQAELARQRQEREAS